MADKIPVKATFDANGDADGLAEFQASETVGYSHGGTGLSSLGTAGQVIKVNAGADGLEWGTIAGDIEEIVTSATSGLSGGATSGAVSLTVDPSQLADGSGITVDTSADFLILEDATDGTVYKVFPNQIASGSANALVDGDSDFTITDGLTAGLDYDLDNTDVASWNNAGIQLTADGGIYHNALTQNQNFTVASTSGAVAVGALNIVGTITVAGNLVVL